MSESDEDGSPIKFVVAHSLRAIRAARQEPKTRPPSSLARLLAEAAPEIMRVVVERAKTGDLAICKILYPSPSETARGGA